MIQSYIVVLVILQMRILNRYIDIGFYINIYILCNKGINTSTSTRLQSNIKNKNFQKLFIYPQYTNPTQNSLTLSPPSRNNREYRVLYRHI